MAWCVVASLRTRQEASARVWGILTRDSPVDDAEAPEFISPGAMAYFLPLDWLVDDGHRCSPCLV